jgi:uncharacterized protein YhdP
MPATPESNRPRSLGLLGRLSRRTLIVLLIVAFLLIVGRAVLPAVLKHEVNLRLSHIPGYSGRVDDVGVQVWHGGYRMYGLVIAKRDGQVTEPFVNARRVQFSIAYRELLRGKVVSDVEVENASLNFVKGPTAASSETDADKRWQAVIQDLFPISITHLKIRDSRIRFVDTTTKPKVDIAINHFEFQADGLRNRPARKAGPYPATIVFSGETIGGGNLKAHIQADPLASDPHFKLNLSLQNVSLPALNDFLMAYVNVDVGAGRFEAYIEATGADGTFQGYVKPFFKDLAFANAATDQQKSAWQRVWKELVAATANLIKNKQENQIATLVPISGKFSQGTSVDFWRTLGNLLRNGFIRALREGLEGSATAKKGTPVPETPAAHSPAPAAPPPASP